MTQQDHINYINSIDDDFIRNNEIHYILFSGKKNGCLIVCTNNKDLNLSDFIKYNELNNQTPVFIINNNISQNKLISKTNIGEIENQSMGTTNIYFIDVHENANFLTCNHCVPSTDNKLTIGIFEVQTTSLFNPFKCNEDLIFISTRNSTNIMGIAIIIGTPIIGQSIIINGYNCNCHKSQITNIGLCQYNGSIYRNIYTLDRHNSCNPLIKIDIGDSGAAVFSTNYSEFYGIIFLINETSELVFFQPLFNIGAINKFNYKVISMPT